LSSLVELFFKCVEKQNCWGEKHTKKGGCERRTKME